MGSELLTEDAVANEGDSDKSESPFLIAKMLDDCFPYYLSIGMTYDEYWYGDPSLVVAYRKAEDIRTHRKNWEMWMNGRYVYDAIIRLIPSLNMWKPKEPIEYMKEPYPLTRKEYEEMVKKEEKKRQDEMREKLKAFAIAQNARRKETTEVTGNG